MKKTVRGFTVRYTELREGPERPRYFALCAASGCVWAAIAYGLGHQGIPRGLIWSGMAVSPLIGLAVGATYRPRRQSSRLVRVAMSLLTLYLAAALFGLAVGLVDALRGLPHDVPRGAVEVIFEGVAGTLWGLTFTGFVAVLWPLAYLNHWLLNRYADPAADG